ncbi:MAG: hypothetical protein J5616_04225 [Bacteroidaceae bacterium]|nr:hypothetical protein [Bacteroidaceae bacterium]
MKIKERIERMDALIERYRDKLTDANTLLDKTRAELDQSKHTVWELQEKIKKMEHDDAQPEMLMKSLLWKWLDKDSRKKVEHIVRFYRADVRICFYYAMLDYVMTGHKMRFEKPVQQWHFRLFCDMVDDNHFTVPSHSWLIRLWEKVGLLRKIEEPLARR